jgi:hypothetical protein
MLQSSIVVSFKNTSDTTTDLILKNIPTFSCQKAATSTFLNLYFYPWIYQELQCEGKYNMTTQICEEEDYDDYEGDYEVVEDEEEEEVEKTPSSSSSASATSPSSSTPTLATNPVPIDLSKPFFQFHTIKPPSRPSGDMCPFKHLYGLYSELNNTKYSLFVLQTFPIYQFMVPCPIGIHAGMIIGLGISPFHQYPLG